MNVLVLNCGSSSVKFRLIATDLDLIARNADRRLAKGTIERIGGEAIVRLQVGIGENSPEVRARICNGLQWIGIELNEELNRSHIGREGLISREGSRTAVYVIPTDEELLIARDTVRCVERAVAEPAQFLHGIQVL